MRKSLFLLAFLASLLLLSPKKTLASNPIRITGFDYPRNQQPFYNPFKSEDWGEDYVSEIVSAINNPNNFGGSGAIVNCGVSWLPFVNTIFPNSLVSGTQKTADVFIAGSITPELSSTEAMELKNFLQAGGVVFISGNSQGSPNADYHSFFELLGVNDRFSSEYDESEEIGISHTPISTPITNGAFGQVGRLGHLPFRIFNHSSLIPVAKAFEEGGFFTVLSFHTASTGLSENFILFEKGFGGGYLSVAGEPIYISDYNYENVRYFLNLVGYACGRNSGGGGFGGSINLNVPILKQTDPRWANQVYNNYSPTDTNQTISKWGCALTSATMILNYYNHNITPGELNNWLKQNNGYDRRHGVRFDIVAKYATDNRNLNENRPGLEYSLLNYSTETLQNELQNNRPAIVRVSNPISPNGAHFVVAKGVEGNDFKINDPYYNRDTLSQHSPSINLRLFQPSFTDPSYLVFEIDPHINIQVFTPNGEEILGAYFLESSLAAADIENELSGKPLGIFAIPKPLRGKYTVKLNNSNGTYRLDFRTINREGEVSVGSFDGIISYNYEDVFEVNLDDINTSKQIVTIDSVINDLEAAYQQGYINNRKVYLALRTELLAAKSFAVKNQTVLYKLTLRLSLASIKKLTPRYLTTEVSQILQNNINKLI